MWRPSSWNKNRLSIVLPIALTVLLIAATCAVAQEGAAANFDYQAMQERAKSYFDAYQRLDMAAMAENYHADAEFLDETAEAIGAAYRVKGKDQIRTAFEAFVPSILKLKIEFTQKYFAGKIGVFRGIYHARVKGGAIGRAPDQLFDIEYPFMTILEFEDGLVRKHIDYIDYRSMTRMLQELEPVGETP